MFDLVARAGSVPGGPGGTLNCGVGMVALIAPDDVDTAVAVLAGHGIRAWVAGEVRRDGGDGGRVRLGRHPGW